MKSSNLLKALSQVTFKIKGQNFSNDKKKNSAMGLPSQKNTIGLREKTQERFNVGSKRDYILFLELRALNH